MKSAYEIVEHVRRIAEILREERARLDATTGADATPFAGHIARALRAAGARLADGNPNRLRWAVNESPAPMNDPTAYRATGELVRVILEALSKGAGEDAILDDVAAVWPKHETKAAAEAEIARIHQARAAESARAAAEAHAERLRTRTPIAPTRPVAAHAPRPHPAAAAEGEFTYGDEYAGAGVE